MSLNRGNLKGMMLVEEDVYKYHDKEQQRLNNNKSEDEALIAF